MKKYFFLLTFLVFLMNGYSQESRLLRFPAIHGNQVVFTFAGDLYTVDKTGGLARKLTNDEKGFEMFARFSPDGRKIAFTGQYDGNTEVYLMQAEGGIPKRLTYTATLGRDDVADRMGPNNIVMTWKDNENILFRSRKQTFNDFKGQLFLESINGGLPEELPLPAGGFASFSPDGSKLAYNRVFREFRTWKYYKGGMADDIVIYDFKTKKTDNITNHPAQDIFPMWVGSKIYFCSDRDRIMNLFYYDLSTKETKKVTSFTEFDIKFPSLGDQAIIFENGGFLYTYELASGQLAKIPIIIADDQIAGRNEMKDAAKFINTGSIAPDGKRVAFGARGDVFTVPEKNGITKNLTQSPGVHERGVAWSPDGKYIAYISDLTGEDEIYIEVQDGSSAPVQLTRNADTYKYNPVWSPDSKMLAWSDKMLRLQYINIETKAVTQVDKSEVWEFNEYGWSPDSKWLTYSKQEKANQTRIWIYDLAGRMSHPVTDGWYNSGSPSFSNDGRFLFFTSNRDFNPTYSWTEWNHTYTDMMKVYFITLSKATPSPFAPENDEVAVKKENEDKKKEGAGEKKETGEKKKDDETAKVPDVKIELDGIIDRTVALPVEASLYDQVIAIGDNVYYIKRSKRISSLMTFNLKDKKESSVTDADGYEISADTKKMLIMAGGKFAVTDLPKSKAEVRDWLDLSKMKIVVDQKAEWAQIYNESWRQMKYFYFAPNMSGVDWEGIKKKYEPLLPYVNHRNDLSYVIGEMIGELSTGHAYVEGGDKPQPERIKQGLLGARFSRDASGYFRIDKILKGENWSAELRSPLADLGVDVKEGEYIIAVNGKSVSEVNDISRLLVNCADGQVELTVNGTPTETGARKVLVIPTGNEEKLYYYNWVQENIRKVDEATKGQVGYIHIPDMGPEGLNEFVKHFYPQLNKRALIIDDRGNGGGNVSPMIIERLNREMTMIRMARNTSGTPGRLEMIWGPKVMLIDRYSASDGDLFPYQFKKLKMGKIIGTRSWGGVVGIRGSLPFIDGGSLRRPEFAPYDTEGKEWIIEGYGVDPDIVIDNDPAKEYAGEDEQLNKAIEVILEDLKSWPKELPGIPPYPDKTK